jgi:hypothetical protein
VTAVWWLRDAIDRGVELKHHEAVAIAQQLIASINTDGQPAAPLGPPSLEPPSLENVGVGPDGSIVCRTCASASSVSEIAVLLEAMLPRGGTTRVPSALRFTVARALCEVLAPPFASLLELSAALTRHEQGDRSQVLRDLYARVAATSPRVVAFDGERRRRGPSVAELRRQLREADEELFHQLNATHPASGKSPGPDAIESLALPAEPVDVTPQARRSAARRRIMGTAAAVAIACGVGYAIGEIRSSRPVPNGVVTWPSVAEVPLADPLAMATPAVHPHETPAAHSRYREGRAVGTGWRGGRRQASRDTPAVWRVPAGVWRQSDENRRPGESDRLPDGSAPRSSRSPMNASVADVQALADHIFQARGEPLR